MTSSLKRAALVLATLTVVSFLLTPATAVTFLTKKKADKRYVNVSEKASDSDLLDGRDSSAFLGATQKAADADLLDGQNASAFLGANQTAADSDLLDGMDSAAFQGAYERTVVVSPVGTPLQNGAALLQALASITDNSNTNPYLLKIEPGFYFLGSTPLQMKTHVDIEGSGRLITSLQGDGGNAPGSATVLGAPNAEIRNLSVLTFGGAYATGIRLTGNTIVSQVRVSTSAASVQNRGIEVLSGVPFLFDVWVDASAPVNSNAYGVFSTGNPYMTDGFVRAIFGGTASYAIYVEDGQFTIDRSALLGTTDAIHEAGPSSLVLVGASRLQGGVAGSVACAQTYDSTYAAAENSTCPS